MPPAAVCKSVSLQDKEEGLCLQLLSESMSAYRKRRRDFSPQLLSASLSAYRIRMKAGLCPPAAVMPGCLLTGQGERTSICPQLLLSACV